MYGSRLKQSRQRSLGELIYSWYVLCIKTGSFCAAQWASALMLIWLGTLKKIRVVVKEASWKETALGKDKKFFY